MLNKPIPIFQHPLDEDTDQLVSISCMTYNHESYIRDTIEGFLMQKTTFPVKIIIFEDCSSDNTANIIREYKTKHPHLFNVFLQSENTWGKPIRKKALEPYYKAHYKSKYIALCEGDDYWIDPLKLQKQVDFLEINDDYGLVYTEIDRVDERGNIIDRNFFETETSAFCQTFEDYLIHAPFRAPCTWLYRRNLYKRREKKYAAGDFPLLLDIVAHSKIHKLEDTTTRYRVLTNSASHSNNIDAFYLFSRGVHEVQLDYANKYKVKKEIVDTIKVRFALQFYDFAVAKHDLNQIRTANKLLMQQKNLSFKFKVAIFLSMFKLGRKLVRYRLIKRLGFTHS